MNTYPMTESKIQYNQRNLNNYYSMSAHFAIAVFLSAIVCVCFPFNLDSIFEFVCKCTHACVCVSSHMPNFFLLNWNDVKLYLSENTKFISICAYSLLTFKVMLILERILHMYPTIHTHYIINVWRKFKV